MSAVAHRSFSRLAGWLLAVILVVAATLISAPPARADDVVGSLSGTVTDEVGNLVQDVYVIAFAHDVPGHGGESWTDWTGDDGSYAFDELPAGTYKLVFETESASPSVVAEWWEDAADRDSATVVTVGAGSTTTGISPQLSSAGAFAGTVTDEDDKPVEGVGISVYGYDVGNDTWTFRGETFSSEDGTYVVEGLVAGDYRIRFTTGGASADVVSEWWEDAADESSATIVKLAVGAKVWGIDPRLAPTPGSVLESSIPVISGTARFGEVLTVNLGQWTDGTEFTYQWRADGAAIGGATSASLALSAAQVGKQISVVVRGTKEGLPPATKTSAPTAPVAPITMTAGTPRISGVIAIGSTVTAHPGAWPQEAKLSYQWFADDAAISGATGPTYVITAAQVGKKLTIRVTGALTNFLSVAVLSEATASVPLPALAASIPTISGTAAVDSTVTAKPGTWASGAKLSFQWHADGVAISSATNATYLITAAEVGKKLTVRVSGALTGYASAAKTSAQTAVVKTGALVAPVPMVSGAVAVGSTLTAKPGTWTSGTAFSYQWFANGVAIKGATKSTFKLASAQKAKAISVKVTGKKSGYSTAAKSSAKSAKVATVATPTISGTKTVGKTLTAKPGAWTSGTTFSYQWYANGVAIKSATKSTLKLTSTHKGKAITVKVTGKKSGYATVAKTSKATAKVK